MKKFIFGIILSCFILSPIYADETKYEVNFKIKYNAVTIEELQDLLARMKKVLNGSCGNSITVEKINNTIAAFSGNISDATTYTICTDTNGNIVPCIN
jgi:hypothetical protein